MKYYLIVGEASGDLHASHLMAALQRYDEHAEFRFFGGDKMKAVGGTMVRHYKDTAFMGFLPVLLHLRTIFGNMSLCKQDITEWQPDVVIPVDYAGFNLNIARYVHDVTESGGKNGWGGAPVFYYISPKIWAWKEGRIRNFKRDVDEMFCILPFEKGFFEKKHNYPVHYVGNPTADEVRSFRASYTQTKEEFCRENGLNPELPIIALLAGSRKHEIKDNLPAMVEVAQRLRDEGKDAAYQFVVAGAPAVEPALYDDVLQHVPDGMRTSLHVVHSLTYPLLAHATAALVTSGTATLETACFDVPQVVCYKTVLPSLYSWGFRHVIKCDYISLVNLIADSEVVKELFAARFSVDNIYDELKEILPNGSKREQMLAEYKEVRRRLGNTSAPDNCARLIVEKLQTLKNERH